MKLGNTIATLRRKQGLKQKALAAQCGVSPAYLSQIENGHRDPTLSVVESIGTHLGVPLPFLFFLALDEEDVPEHKREAFMLLAPSIRSLVGALLGENPNEDEALMTQNAKS